MYPEMMIAPMRQELTSAGIAEARSATEVEAAIQEKGTVMVVVNSVCGCAAGKMRPGVRAVVRNSVRPDRMITVFAGQDREATEAARSYFTGYPPSSPSKATTTFMKATRRRSAWCCRVPLLTVWRCTRRRSGCTTPARAATLTRRPRRPTT